MTTELTIIIGLLCALCGWSLGHIYQVLAKKVEKNIDDHVEVKVELSKSEQTSIRLKEDMSDLANQMTNSSKILTDVGIKVQLHSMKIGNLEDGQAIIKRSLDRVKNKTDGAG